MKGLSSRSDERGFLYGGSVFTPIGMSTDTTANFNHNAWKAKEAKDEKRQEKEYHAVKESKLVPWVYFYLSTKKRGIKVSRKDLVPIKP